MNQKSPGNNSVDDDIEMLGLDDVVEKMHSPLLRQNGVKHTPHVLLRNVEESSDEDDDDDGGEHDGAGRRALLGSHQGTLGHGKLVSPVGKRWSHIKSIVIEVRGRYQP